MPRENKKKSDQSNATTKRMTNDIGQGWIIAASKHAAHSARNQGCKGSKPLHWCYNEAPLICMGGLLYPVQTNITVDRFRRILYMPTYTPSHVSLPEMLLSPPLSASRHHRQALVASCSSPSAHLQSATRQKLYAQSSASRFTMEAITSQLRDMGSDPRV